MKRYLLILLFVTISLCLFSQTAVTPAGSGTEANPYLIANLNNLFWIADQVNNAQNNFSGVFFKQTADIDASVTSTWFVGDHDNNAATPDVAMGWAPIGYYVSSSVYCYFLGTYDGDGHVVSGLYINHPPATYQGLFGITNMSNLKNLGVINADIWGYRYVGALGGFVSGSISKCYSSGTVKGYDSIGGFVGRANSATVDNCFNRANVIATSYFDGGLIGYNYSTTVNNCYSTGTVTGPYFIGALIGWNYSCTINNSFWDTQTSGMATGVAYNTGPLTNVVGKTTDQMKTQTTFTDAGWDFTNIWNIDPSVNNGYPHLTFTVTPPVPNVPANVVIQPGTTPGTIAITWDDMGADWYGIYSGNTTDNLVYLGWCVNNSLTLTADSCEFVQVTSGNGTPLAPQLDAGKFLQTK